MQYITRTASGDLDLMRCNAILRHIASELAKVVDVATVGLSGGADSTLVAAICVRALGEENVYGYSLPYSTTDQETFNSRSKALAEYLEINHDTLQIIAASNGFCEPFKEDGVGLSELNQGNLRSRLRMVYLYTMNQVVAEKNPTKRCRVIGTGNLSEDYIGYDTKGGDSLADIFPIGLLYKQEVYDLLDTLTSFGEILPEHIDRVPSAGLWEGQTDEQELGHTYNDMAPAIELLRKRANGIDIIDDVLAMTQLSPSETATFIFVKERHTANKHKHEAPPVIALSPYGRD